MSLTSSSTVQDALDQWNDNLIWEGDSSKAQLALEAGRFLLANRPVSHSHQGTTINFSTIEGTISKIEASLRSSSSTRAIFTRARAKQT